MTIAALFEIQPKSEAAWLEDRIAAADVNARRLDAMANVAEAPADECDVWYFLPIEQRRVKWANDAARYRAQAADFRAIASNARARLAIIEELAGTYP